MYFCKMIANVRHWHMSHMQTFEVLFLIHLNALTQDLKRNQDTATYERSRS